MQHRVLNTHTHVQYRHTDSVTALKGKSKNYNYTAVIRPVLEYAAPAWHHLINRTQAQHLESVQKRAIHIISNFTRGMSYPNVLFVAQLESLETRHNNLSRSFFKIFANQPPVFIISYHLPEIPPLPLG